MSSLPSALRARLFLESPIHWKRWCRRELHLWQVPKAFSLQRHKRPYATVATVPAGRLQHVLPLALAWNSWCGKRMGNAHKSDCSLLCCRVQLAAFLRISAVKKRMLCHCGLQWEENFRHCEFTATASWEEGQQRWEATVCGTYCCPPQRIQSEENHHALGNWGFRRERKSVHPIRGKMKLFWNQLWEMCCLCKLFW